MKIQLLLTIISCFAFISCSQGQSQETQGNSQHAQSITESSFEDKTLSKVSFDIPSGTYMIDKTHGYIAFSYDHGGFSKPQLRWGNWDSTLEWNSDKPETSKVDVTIDVAKIDTGVPKFDDHMRANDIFDVQTYPTIKFISTNVEQLTETTGRMTGDLTIKDITKPITLDVKFNKAALEERWNVYKIGFSATTNLKRSEWGVGYAIPYVGDDIEILIEVEYVKPSA